MRDVHDGEPQAPTHAPDLLALTLDAAIHDAQTVTPESKPTSRLPEGVSIFRRPTHVDDRGWLVELYDPRWQWHPDPLVHAYACTVRPSVAKGWAMHKLTEDRYFVLSGHGETVLYDVRPDSSTRGQVSVVRMSEFDRCLMNIPTHIWHATRNVGSTDLVLVNFKTRPYDHANPDKYRLPLDSPLIPYSFEGVTGW